MSYTKENQSIDYNRPYIKFKDPEVERICMQWSEDGIGVTYVDAGKVTSQQFWNKFRNNTQIVSFDELKFFTGLTSIPEAAFMYCSALRSVVFPSEITMLGSNAFNGAALTEVDFPVGLVTINGVCFYNCLALKTIISRPSTPPTIINDLAFWDVNPNNVYVPYSEDHDILASYQSAPYWSVYASKMYELNPDGTIPTT